MKRAFNLDWVSFAKKNFTKLPFSVGRYAALVPYQLRPLIGDVYAARMNDIKKIQKLDLDRKKAFVFERVKNVSCFAYNNVPFYQELYRRLDVDPERFRSFGDLCELPIISKSDLQSVSLEFRSHFAPGRSLVNTGGSSGNPLEMYVSSSSVGHEWAHMHQIWRALGFSQRNVKVVFAGRSDLVHPIEYDSARHQFNVDIYRGWKAIVESMERLFSVVAPRYIHGYPSAIFDFVLWLEDNRPSLLASMRSAVQGIFLSSEFPSPELRAKVDRLLDCKSISWYGHTERAVLAYEKERFGIYYPFLSYGFAESAQSDEGCFLLGTSYYNFSSPLIRYNTEDRISPTYNGELLESFAIEEGRSSEYILDRSSNKIFLTGLIFGRHHRLFDVCRNVQVRQRTLGEVEILVVPRASLSEKEVSELFDQTNVDLDFKFLCIDAPIRTQAGKVPLLVRN